MRRFLQLGDPDTIATAKKTFVRKSGPSQKKKNTPSLSSVKSSVSIKKPSASSGSKRPLPSPSIKNKSSSVAPVPKKKTAAVPIKKAKLLDESEDEETETSTTTEESDYSLHDDSAEDDTPTEEDREDGDGSDVPSQLSETARCWKEYYRMTSDRNKTQRGHFLSQFYFFLMHGVGGSIREEQTLLHVRQVHMILEAMDPDGKDLCCLIRNNSMDIWTEFLKPNLDDGTLKGNTLKAYLKSLELFGQFIERGVFYKKTYLTDKDKSLSSPCQMLSKTIANPFVVSQPAKQPLGKSKNHLRQWNQLMCANSPRLNMREWQYG